MPNGKNLSYHHLSPSQLQQRFPNFQQILVPQSHKFEFLIPPNRFLQKIDAFPKTFAANGQSTKLTLRVEANTIFQINATYTPLEEATNNKTIEGGTSSDVVLDAVGIGITLIDSSIDSVANARSSLGFLQKEIESVAEQLGTIGANLSELEVATERLQNQVYLSEKGLSRVGQDALIEESTRFAKQNIKSQAATALLSQAFSISEKVLNVIL